MSDRPDSWERISLDELPEPDYEKYPLPDPDDLERVPIDEFECPCGCTDE